MALKVKNGPVRIPRLAPCKLDNRKSKNTQNLNFDQSRKMDLWSTFPSCLTKKVKLHIQTFHKPHENGCPIDLRPKQASYSDLTQNYATSENHSDGHLRTKFSNTNQQNIVANNTPNASPLVPHAKTSKITRRIISSSLVKVVDPLGLVTPVTLLPNFFFQKTWDGI